MARTSVIKINEMAAAIRQSMEDWSQEVADATKQAAVETAMEAVQDLRKNSPKRTLRYAGSWTRKVTAENRFMVAQTIYNKKYYRLTHLLEHGHANARGGGRTQAYPHIGLAEQRAIELMETKARQYINDID